MGLGIGLCCCGGCDCLTYQAGSFQLYPFVRFASEAYGLSIGCTRQVDLTLWRGTSTVGAATNVMGLRIPTSGKPRLIYLYNPTPTTLASADFDALGARPGVLFECQANVWTLLESNDFTYRGAPTTASAAAVDGVAAPPPTLTGAPDAVWCNPSYIPDPIQLTFSGLVDDTGATTYNRTAFNGVGLSCSLSSSGASGGRTTKIYTGTFYTNVTAACGGDPTARPAGTLRWIVTVTVNYATVADGTASTISVSVQEDAPIEFVPGCWKFGSGSGSPNSFRYKRFRWLSTFDKLDDGLGIGHWIPMFNWGTDSAVGPSPGNIPPIVEGLYFTKQSSNMNGAGATIGNLLRVTP